MKEIGETTFPASGLNTGDSYGQQMLVSTVIDSVGQALANKGISIEERDSQ